MLNALFTILSTSYFAWYLENFEHAAVYPFDATYATPAEAGAPGLTEGRTTTDDGTTLVVWRHEADAGKPTVLYFKGNAGGLKDRVERFQRLTSEGFGLVAPAYRGSSGSTGAPEERNLVDDARQMAASVAGPLVLYGESLGAAVAIQLAAGGTGDALVLEAPFTSLVDLVAAQYPTEDLARLITQRWDSLSKVSDVRQPLLVIHGEDDRLVPVEMGERIFKRAGSARKTLLTVPDQGHAGTWTGDTLTALFEFLNDPFQIERLRRTRLIYAALWRRGVYPARTLSSVPAISFRFSGAEKRWSAPLTRVKRMSGPLA